MKSLVVDAGEQMEQMSLGSQELMIDPEVWCSPTAAAIRFVNTATKSEESQLVDNLACRELGLATGSQEDDNLTVSTVITRLTSEGTVGRGEYWYLDAQGTRIHGADCNADDLSCPGWREQNSFTNEGVTLCVLTEDSEDSGQLKPFCRPPSISQDTTVTDTSVRDTGRSERIPPERESFDSYMEKACSTADRQKAKTEQRSSSYYYHQSAKIGTAAKKSKDKLNRRDVRLEEATWRNGRLSGWRPISNKLVVHLSSCQGSFCPGYLTVKDAQLFGKVRDAHGKRSRCQSNRFPFDESSEDPQDVEDSRASSVAPDDVNNFDELSSYITPGEGFEGPDGD